MKESDKSFANMIVKHPWLLYKKWLEGQENKDEFKLTLDFYAKIPNSRFATKVNSTAQNIVQKIIAPPLHLSKI